MADGMPSTYDTQTTTTTTTSTIFFDSNMLKSREVMLKIGEALALLIGLICVACAANSYVSQAGWFDFVASVGLIVAIILAVFYIFHIRDKIAPTLRLNLVEMVYAALWAFFCFTAAIACIVHGSKYYNQEALIAAGFFGLVAMVLYGLDAFLMFNAWRSGATRTATQTTHHTSATASPAY